MKEYISPKLSLLAVTSTDIMTLSVEQLGGLNEKYAENNDGEHEINSFEYKW